LSVLVRKDVPKFTLLLLFLLPFLVYSQQVDKESLKKRFKRLTAEKIGESVGSVIDVSDLKIGFLNDGRFCAPPEFVSELPSALYGKYGYLGKLDLWVGIPDGPWAPQAWDSQKGVYVSVGPTVTGTEFALIKSQWGGYYYIGSGNTEWSSIPGTKGIFYTDAVSYSEIYRSSGDFDFFLAPTSTIPKTFPKSSFTGLPVWPGKWRTDPYTGKPLEGEFLGDQDVFLTFEDRVREMPGNGDASLEFYRAKGYPIGAEVHAQISGFQEGYIANMIIYDLEIINISQWDYHDVYLGIYYESDNPYYWTTQRRPHYDGLKTRYSKNSDAYGDENFPYNLSYNYNTVYGDPDNDAKVFGVQFLKTPLAQNDGMDNDGDGLIDEDEGEQLGLTGWHFIDYNCFAYDDIKKLQYKLLSGDTTDVNHDLIDDMIFFKDENDSLDPNFDCSSRIQRKNYWLNRGSVWLVYDLLSCGPLNWASGDTLHFVFGILVADTPEKLLVSAKIARKIVDHGYNRSLGPPPPQVRAVPGDGKVTLYWDSSAEEAEDFITGYKDFEGYRIYRTTVDPKYNDWGEKIFDHDRKLIGFIPVAECDLDNDISGYENVYPFQKLGDDTGLFHTWTDSTVTNGVTYWYSVCAYDHGIIDSEQWNPDGFPPSPLNECPKGTDPEISPNLVKVIPGLTAANYEEAKIEIIDLGESSGNGPIEVKVLDPQAVTGHNYLIAFEDTTYGYAVYDLYDDTEDSLLFSKVTQTNGEEGPIFDGLQLNVKRYDDMEVLNEKTFWYKKETGEKSNCTWSIFGGKINWDPYPYEYDIIFTDKMDTSHYMKKTAPFEIRNTVLNKKSNWDIFFDAETDSTDSMKATWTSGDVIYIWDQFNEKNKFTLRIIIRERTIFTYQGMLSVPPQPGDVAHIALKRPFITGDKFRISTQPIKKKIAYSPEEKPVKVVPNPLIVRAGWELNSNEGKIQFINLPGKCTIHIFTSTGERVQVLQHDDPYSDYEFWDLLNFSNLKVSYGLYMFVVETPDGKADKGKFVILH